MLSFSLRVTIMLRPSGRNFLKVCTSFILPKHLDFLSYLETGLLWLLRLPKETLPVVSLPVITANL